MVLKRLGLHSDAVDVMVEAVNREPLHWGAWHELALLIHDKDMVGIAHLHYKKSCIRLSLLTYCE